MRKMKLERGFTLVGVMVAAAIGGIVILGIASSFSAMFSAQTSVNLSSDAQTLVDEIRTNLENEKSCETALRSRTFDRDAAQNSLTGVTISLSGVAKTIDVASNDPVVIGLLIREISAVPNTSVDAVDTTMTIGNVVTPVRRHVATIKIAVEKTGSAMTKNLPPTYIPIQIYTARVNGPTPILSCNNGPSAATVCNELANHVWNGSDCVPVNQCVSGGNYSDAPLGSGGFVNPLTNAQTCPAGFERRRDGSVAASNRTGKTMTDNVFYATYECTRCYDNAGNVTTAGSTAAVAPISSSIGVDDSEYDLSEANFQTADTRIATLISDLGAQDADAVTRGQTISQQQATLNNNAVAINSLNEEVSTLNNQAASLRAQIAAAQAAQTPTPTPIGTPFPTATPDPTPTATPPVCRRQAMGGRTCCEGETDDNGCFWCTVFGGRDRPCP